MLLTTKKLISRIGCSAAAAGKDTADKQAAAKAIVMNLNSIARRITKSLPHRFLERHRPVAGRCQGRVRLESSDVNEAGIIVPDPRHQGIADLPSAPPLSYLAPLAGRGRNQRV
jgi:hypothetical protein